MRKFLMTMAMLGLLTVSIAPTAAQTTGRTIVDIASSDSRFDTLQAALGIADLVDDLSGAGPFTVFAPTDAAFAALPAGVLDSLIANPSALTDVLRYHVVAGEVPASAVVTLNSADTLLNEPVYIQVIDGKVVLNGTVKVIITDIRASNGIIHAIDAVLIPPQRDLQELVFVNSDTAVLSGPAGEDTGNVARTCQTFFVTERIGAFANVPSVFGWINASNTQIVPPNYGQPGGPNLC